MSVPAILVLGLIAAAAFAVVWVFASSRNEPDAAVDIAWQRAAELLRLEYVSATPTAGPTLTGISGDMEVIVDTFVRPESGTRRDFTRVVVTPLERNRLTPGPEQSRLNPNDPLTVLLRETNQARIADLVTSLGATVVDGRVRWAEEGLAFEPNAFAAKVREVLRAAEYLSLTDADIPARLLANSRDPSLSESTRRRSLELLFDRFPQASEAQSAAREVLESGTAGLRLRAAIALGREGLDGLRAFAADPATAPDLRQRAVSELLERHPPDIAGPHLRALLLAETPEVGREVVHLIRERAHRDALPMVLALLPDPRLSAARIPVMLETVADLGDATAEPVVLGMLHHADGVVRRNAAAALARIGTPAALPTLREHMDSDRVEERVRTLCRSAVREIESRYGT